MVFSKNPQVKSITNIWLHKELDAQFEVGLCDTCTTIPFDKLPHEEDQAFPHKQDLLHLEESSKVCKLCKLILSAIKDAQGDFDLEGYDIADTMRPKKNSYEKIYSQDLFASKKFGVHQVLARVPGIEINLIMLRSRSKHVGSETDIGPSGPLGSSNELVSRTEVEKDLSNRVWLYGNWWTLLGVKQSPQLIGFGARLTRYPRMRISNVNGERRTVLYRGSDIRVFVECGNTPYLCPWQSSYSEQMIRWLIKYHAKKLNQIQRDTAYYSPGFRPVTSYMDVQN
jgi:hypothetical protein